MCCSVDSMCYIACVGPFIQVLHLAYCNVSFQNVTLSLLNQYVPLHCVLHIVLHFMVALMCLWAIALSQCMRILLCRLTVFCCIVD